MTAPKVRRVREAPGDDMTRVLPLTPFELGHASGKNPRHS